MFWNRHEPGIATAGSLGFLSHGDGLLGEQTMPDDNGDNDTLTASLTIEVDKDGTVESKYLGQALSETVEDCTSGRVRVTGVEVEDE